MRKLILCAAVLIFSAHIVASDLFTSLLAPGYSIHLGEQQFLLAQSNLEKSALLSQYALNPFIFPDTSRIKHIYLQGLPEDFVHVYRYLVDGSIDAKTSDELDRLKQNAERYQVTELQKQLAVMSIEKVEKEPDYIWIKTAKVVRFIPDMYWDDKGLADFGVKFASEYKTEPKIKTVKIKDLGFNNNGNKFFLVVNQEKRLCSKCDTSKPWKRKVMLFHITPPNDAIWKEETVDIANDNLSRLFKNPKKNRLFKAEPMGFTRGNRLMILLTYDTTE
ncbi:MAG TPA: hypothetical protein VEL47_05050 [Myxococcota bacterium]|nr:hypothetical protein [Myxococcota bacterium]